MNYRVLETEKSDFERQLRIYGAEGWVPLLETKQSVVVREHQEEGDRGRVYYEEVVIHTMILQKWIDGPEDQEEA